MELRFPLKDVIELIKHANDAPQHKLTGGQQYAEPPVTPSAGLWLVGDQGVYLMSNGSPHLLADEPKTPNSSKIVHANGCNPDVDDFDTWWANKNASFGGDDGCDYLPVPTNEEVDMLYGTGKMRWYCVDITSTSMTVTFRDS